MFIDTDTNDFIQSLSIATCLLVLFLFAGPTLHAQSIIYVDAGASGANDGSSWDDAYTNLRTALSNASGTNEVWIAAGVYKPTSGSDQTISFEITASQNGIEIYGGFDGTETSRSERDPTTNITVLSGDINNNDNTDENGITWDASDINGDNTQHLVYLDGSSGSGITSSTILDGVTITGGEAGLNTQPSSDGGGVFCNGRTNSTCSPTLSNITFAGNYAWGKGGALFNNGIDGTSNPTIVNAVFTGNEANRGGAIYSEGPVGDASPTLINAVFVDNEAWRGGAMYNDGGNGTSSPTLINTTFTGNIGRGSGGALYNESASPEVHNSIFWDNGDEINNNSSTSTISYSLVEGGCEAISGTDCGDGTLDGDPLFADRDNPAGSDLVFGTLKDGLRLSPSSPALNAGDNETVPSNVETDLLGEARIQDGTVSMGPYEQDAGDQITSIHHVAANADGNEEGDSFENAFVDLQDALAVASSNDIILVGAGTYTPGPDADDAFKLDGTHDGIRIYGGWSGAESFDTVEAVEAALNTRDPGAHPAVLDGQGANYHVLYLDGATEGPITDQTIIDGFTVTGGAATGSASNGRGGGMLCEGTGSGSGCSPFLERIVFTENLAYEGGALYADGSDGGASNPTLINSVFVNNTAETPNDDPALGGALLLNGRNGGTSSPTITNTTIAGNTGEFGGAVYHRAGSGSSSEPVFTNTILYDNIATDTGDQVRSWDSGAAPVFSHTLIENGPDGVAAENDAEAIYKDEDGDAVDFEQSTNLDAAPQFVTGDNPTGDDAVFFTKQDGLRLQPGSPALNAGSNEAVDGIMLDLLGEDRIQDGTVSLGAYERPQSTYDGPIYHVKADAMGIEDGSSFDDAFTDLQDALAVATGDDVIVIAAGVYRPVTPANVNNVTDEERSTPFTLTGAHDGLHIYGGWTGTESFSSVSDVEDQLNTRNLDLTDPTTGSILSGDIDLNDAPFVATQATSHLQGDNSYTVLMLDGRPNGDITADTVIDGVALTAGQANGEDDLTRGGGGLICYGSEEGACSPTLRNIVAFGNHADSRGGGIVTRTDGDNAFAAPTLTNAAFIGNTATHGTGAAVLVDGGDASPVARNVFSGGNVGFDTFFIRTEEESTGTFTLAHVTVAENELEFSSLSVSGFEGTATMNVINSILWNNKGDEADEDVYKEVRTFGSHSTVFIGHTIVDGGPENSTFESEGAILDVDPQFVDPLDGDLRLSSTSPAIARGSRSPFADDGVAVDLPADALGNNRLFGLAPDLGAHEYTEIATTESSITDAIDLAGYIDPVGFEGLVLLRNATSGDLSFNRNETTPESPDLPGSVAPFTWTIDTDLTGEDPTYDLALDASDIPGIDDFDALRLYKSEDDGATWNEVTDLGGTLVLNEDENWVAVQDLTGFSQFAIASDEADNPLPVELSRFEAQRADSDLVKLQWETLSETNNAGFEVQRREASVETSRRDVSTGESWQTIATVDGAGTTDEPQSYRFDDTDLPYAADSLTYRLRQIDTDGTESFSDEVVVERQPTEAELLPTYPNPTSSQATVRFAVPEHQHVRIHLYDMLGRRVQTVTDQELEGRHKQGIDVSRMASGTYFLRMETDNGSVDTQRITVVR